MRDLPDDVFADFTSLHTEAAADWALQRLDEALLFELGGKGLLLH